MDKGATDTLATSIPLHDVEFCIIDPKGDNYLLGHLRCLYLPAKNPTDKAAKPKHIYFNVSMIICDVLITHF